MLRNYTNRALTFVYLDNLTAQHNNRFFVEKLTDLRERLYLPTSGPALRVQVERQETRLCFGVPVIEEKLLEADPIPDGDDILVVSRQYAEACRRLCRPTHRLRIVCGGVFTPSLPYPVASTGLAMVEACLPYVQPELFEEPQPSVEQIIQMIRRGSLKPEVKPPAAIPDWWPE